MKQKSFEVTGTAFVPVKVRVTVQAETIDEAMDKANAQFKKSSCREHVVTGSEDYGATFGFDALDAAETKP